MSASSRRALILIDVQNEYVTGNLPIEYPDVRLSLRNIARAAQAAVAAQIPIIVVQNSAPVTAPLFAKGTPGWALHPVVAGLPAAHSIEKSLPSAFTGTDLAAWLTGQDIGILTVAGYMTHNCVDSTIKHALHDGWQVEHLYDATGSVSYANQVGTVSAEAIHRAFSVVLQSRFAAVLTTDAWIEALTSGAPPQRDSIFASNQRARLSLPPLGG
ncbi:MAG: cysteine hydrolase family protein [Azospirillaceae bacterium]|nr:cysteine hydrolase family protein [Azospirillaceae bacterium]